MRIKTQDELLNLNIRKQIIEEIEGSENKARKAKAYKSALCYKDQTNYFVLEELERQFDKTTVYEMSYALSNISFVRKIVDKLARVVNQGAKRTVFTEQDKIDIESTDKVETLEKELCVDSKLKSINQILKLQRNTALYVKPCPQEDESYKLVLQPLQPYLYDVVEDYYDRTKPMCFILSDYEYQPTQYTSQDAAREGRTFQLSARPALGDQKDQIIADSPNDEELAQEKHYIFWSDKFHFTCNKQGEIISEDYENPIQKCPVIPFAIGQENSFWAIGGQDLIDTSVKLNAQLTNITHIGVMQGYGIFYMKGKDLPSNVILGPNKGIMMRYESEDPVPDIGFASANPQLASLMAMVEMQVALLLTTNNLSTSGVSTTLGQASTFPSAIAMTLDKAESMEDVKDQQQLFLDNEPVLWDVINSWNNYYASIGKLDESLQNLQLPENFELVVKYTHAQTIQTEAEKLNNIKLRKELGLNTDEELLKIDQPDLSDEQAKEKLLQINKLKQDKMKLAAEMVTNNEDDKDEPDSEEIDI